MANQSRFNMIIFPTWLVIILTLCVTFLVKWIFEPERKLVKQIKSDLLNGLTPVSLPMATHHENAKFRIRYRNLEPDQELYKIGLRNGQFGVILKHSSGMYAKTTIVGKCHFVRIESYNYLPTG